MADDKERRAEGQPAVVPNDSTKSFRVAFTQQMQLRATEVTRAQRLFARRLTVICFGAALIGEKVSGRGCVSSLGGSTGLGLAQMEPEIILLAVLLAVASFQPGLWPKRGEGMEIWKWMGSSIEYIVDSILCLAFSGSLIVEGVTGKVRTVLCCPTKACGAVRL
jgi:hypothetical protein